MNTPIVGQRDYTVTEIAVTVRASKEYPNKGWRTIELSATATLAPQADVEYAHNDLYESLKERISLLLNGR
jgi:hypothetical protein